MKPITTSCSYDTSVFNTPYINNMVRSGNVIEISFIAQVKAQPSGNVNLITNLPKFAKSGDNPILSWVGTTRYIPDENATPKQLWTSGDESIRTGRNLLTAGNWLYFNYVYITSDTN